MGRKTLKKKKKEPPSVGTSPPRYAFGPVHETDRVTVLTVNPQQIFVHWELTEGTYSKGAPFLRLYDVKGVDDEEGDLPSFFEIKIPTRAGSTYISVLPGREFIVEAGVSGKGGFMPAARSKRVSTPSSVPSGGEAALPEKYYRYQPDDYAAS